MFFSGLYRIGREFGPNLVNLDILTMKVSLLEPKIDVVPNFIANNIFFSCSHVQKDCGPCGQETRGSDWQSQLPREAQSPVYSTHNFIVSRTSIDKEVWRWND